jgi:hypothetical protein
MLILYDKGSNFIHEELYSALESGAGGGTLGSEAKSGGTAGVGTGTGVSWLAVVLTLEKMSASWWRAARWLSLVGER